MSCTLAKVARFTTSSAGLFITGLTGVDATDESLLAEFFSSVEENNLRVDAGVSSF